MENSRNSKIEISEQIESLAKFPSENPNPVMRIAKDGVLIYANDASKSFLEKWGIEERAIVPDRWRQTVDDAFSAGLSQKIEVEHIDQIFAFIIVPILDCGYANLYARDITDRKQVETALKKSEEKYKQISENIETILWEFDISEDRWTYVSPQSEKMLGYKPEEWTGLSFWVEHIHQDDRDWAKRYCSECTSKGEDHEFEYRFLKKDGQVIWLRDTVTVELIDGKPTIMRGFMSDITDRKQAEKKREDLAKFPSENPNPVLRIAENGTLLYANNASISWFAESGYELGKPVSEFWVQKVSEAFKSGTEERIEVEHDKKIFSFAIVPVIQASYANIYGRDITKRKRAEEALLESEKKFRALFEQAAVGVAQINTKTGQFLQINQRYCDIVGYTCREMENLTFQRITHPEDLQADLDNMNELVKGNIREFSMEKRYFHKDGSTVWVNLTVSPLWKQDQVPYYHMAVVEDITERKLAEIELAKSYEELEARVLERTNKLAKTVEALQREIAERKRAEEDASHLRAQYVHIARVSAMGELTASLAHELKQPLAAIRSNAQAAQRFFESDEPDIDEIKEIIVDIVKDNRRADSVIERLRALMRKDGFKLSEININEVVQDAFSLAGDYGITKDVSLKLELDENIPLVSGDSIQLQQVILNLIINSTDAMATMKADLRTIAVRTSQKDSKVTISVTDNGPGIDNKDAEHLFEAFYSTKKEGLGMGLAISRTIINEHGGHLWVENNTDHGATFYFTIPIHQEKSA